MERRTTVKDFGRKLRAECARRGNPWAVLLQYMHEVWAAPQLSDTWEHGADADTYYFTDVGERQRARILPADPNCFERAMAFAAWWELMRRKNREIAPLCLVKGGFKRVSETQAQWCATDNEMCDGRHIAVYWLGLHIRLWACESEFPVILEHRLNDAEQDKALQLVGQTLKSTTVGKTVRTFSDIDTLSALTNDRAGADRDWGSIAAGTVGGLAQGAAEGLAVGGPFGALFGAITGAITGGVGADSDTVHKARSAREDAADAAKIPLTLPATMRLSSNKDGAQPAPRKRNKKHRS